MTNRFPRGKPTLSRRDLLKRAGFLGVIAATGPVGTLVPAATKSDAHPHPSVQVDGAPRGAWEPLTATEAATLEAVAARIIPSDANGPGAVQAGVARYIDRALGV